jgi:effector-binding domain-containing protein
MEYVIATHHVEPQSIVSIRDRRKQTDLPGFLKKTFADLFRRLGLLGVSPDGPPFVIYHEFGPDGVDAEVCVPVAQAVSANGKVQSRLQPAMTVARTLHVGRYEDLGAAYAAVSDWIGRNGFEPAGPVQERYLNGPGDHVAPSEFQTEIDMPIVPLVLAVPV